MLSISLDTVLGMRHFIYLTFCCMILRNIRHIGGIIWTKKPRFKSICPYPRHALTYDTLSQVQHLQRRDLFERTLRGVSEPCLSKDDAVSDDCDPKIQPAQQTQVCRWGIILASLFCMTHHDFKMRFS